MQTKPVLSPATAGRRYRVHVFVAMLLYMALVATTVHLLKAGVAGPLRLVLALLPVLPIVWVMAAVIRYLGQADELQRRVHLEALSIAAGVIAFLSLTYGFLEDFAGLPHISAWWGFVVTDIAWGLAACILWRRYR